MEILDYHSEQSWSVRFWLLNTREFEDIMSLIFENMKSTELCSTGIGPAEHVIYLGSLYECFVSRPDYLYSDLVLLSMSVNV